MTEMERVKLQSRLIGSLMLEAAKGHDPAAAIMAALRVAARIDAQYRNPKVDRDGTRAALHRMFDAMMDDADDRY